MKKDITTPLSILGIFAVVKLLLLPLETTLWWDGAVYVGMAKMLVTGVGLWEMVRPLFWPFLLSMSIPLSIPVVIWGKILEFLASLGIVCFTYLLAKKVTKDEKVSVAAMIIMAFSFIFFFWSYRLYTSVPATFFMLLATYLMSEKKPLLAGLFSTFSVLTRFPLGMFIIPLEYFAFTQKTMKERVRYILLYNIPLALGLAVLLAFNYYWYSDPFLPISQMLSSIGWGSAPILFRNTGVWIYLLTFLVSFHVLLPFIIPGLVDLWKKKGNYHFFLLVPFILGLIVFHLLTIKEERFLIPLFPFAAILIAHGLYQTSFNKWDKVLLITYAVVSVLLIVAISLSIATFKGTTSEEFYFGKGQLDACPHHLRIAASSPVAVGAYDDVLPYYGGWANDRITQEIDSLHCIFISTCDFAGELAPIIEEDFIIGYSDTSGYCKYYGYHRDLRLES